MIWIKMNTIILEWDFFWIKRSNEINIVRNMMNELFDWMKDVIALRIQMENHVAQSFLNKIICKCWRDHNSKRA